MQHLILVKHAMPVVRPEQASNLWPLSEEGRRSCHALAQELAGWDLATVVSSVEPKARETAQIIANLLGVSWEVAQRLHENDRTGFPFLDSVTWKAAFSRFFANPQALVIGRETADQAYRRFAGAVEHVIQEHADQNLAIVTHGTVMSLFVARANGLEPFVLWERLACPSYIVLSWLDYRIIRIADKESGRG
ncbi:MAG TPA: histidine phosphatase family protein [Chthonomonadaceae bacterium]|nr:histidine phosphatase family protein [Chthonomonadaceae bacterium]